MSNTQPSPAFGWTQTIPDGYGSQEWVVYLAPNPNDGDTFARAGLSQKVPGYMLGFYGEKGRQGFDPNGVRRNWWFCPWEKYNKMMVTMISGLPPVEVEDTTEKPTGDKDAAELVKLLQVKITELEAELQQIRAELAKKNALLSSIRSLILPE